MEEEDSLLINKGLFYEHRGLFIITLATLLHDKNNHMLHVHRCQRQNIFLINLQIFMNVEKLFKEKN